MTKRQREMPIEHRAAASFGRLLLSFAAALTCQLAFAPLAQAEVVEHHPSRAFTFGPAVQGLALSISSDKSVYRTGEPILITLAIQDSGPPRAMYRFGSPYEFKLFSEVSGEKIQLLRSPKVETGSAGLRFLQTGDVYHLSFILDQYFKTPPPGTYLVTATTVVKADLNEGSPAVGLVSNAIEITLDQ